MTQHWVPLTILNITQLWQICIFFLGLVDVLKAKVSDQGSPLRARMAMIGFLQRLIPPGPDGMRMGSWEIQVYVLIFASHFCTGKMRPSTFWDFIDDDSKKTRSMEMQLTSNYWSGWFVLNRWFVLVLAGRLGHSCGRMQGTVDLENTNEWILCIPSGNLT